MPSEELRKPLSRDCAVNVIVERINTRRAILLENSIDRLLAHNDAIERMAGYLLRHPSVIIFADRAEIVRGMLEAAKSLPPDLDPGVPE